MPKRWSIDQDCRRSFGKIGLKTGIICERQTVVSHRWFQFANQFYQNFFSMKTPTNFLFWDVLFECWIFQSCQIGDNVHSRLEGLSILWDFLSSTEPIGLKRLIRFNNIAMILHVSTTWFHVNLHCKLHLWGRDQISLTVLSFWQNSLRRHYNTVNVSRGHQLSDKSLLQNKFLIQGELGLAWDQSLNSLRLLCIPWPPTYCSISWYAGGPVLNLLLLLLLLRHLRFLLLLLLLLCVVLHLLNQLIC